jgi:hypothetical protein
MFVGPRPVLTGEGWRSVGSGSDEGEFLDNVIGPFDDNPN